MVVVLNKVMVKVEVDTANSKVMDSKVVEVNLII